jgi:hypothetical protein
MSLSRCEEILIGPRIINSRTPTFRGVGLGAVRGRGGSPRALVTGPVLDSCSSIRPGAFRPRSLLLRGSGVEAGAAHAAPSQPL